MGRKREDVDDGVLESQPSPVKYIQDVPQGRKRQDIRTRRRSKRRPHTMRDHGQVRCMFLEEVLFFLFI